MGYVIAELEEVHRENQALLANTVTCDHLGSRLPLLPQLNPYAVLVFDIVLLIIVIIGALWSRRRLRGELRELWALAAQLGYTTQQVRAIAETAYPQFKYGLIDWDQSRGATPQFFPSRRVLVILKQRLATTLETNNL
ncbi:hypothetical protein [Loigolactobacillus bifermentans]|uniref:Uncharacterized protein n=1 Tax=Loigolactobacillus bifermentans DSM 20003 TaxID=1423726 RepID=A0A0R1GN56_9LACO|nr:hypothetical protein [Loigolactobacillus bifermentans]KRK33140.1 hypothetical protein FC07_GL001393 [Loigolactobacillus bifermentans DSM 20003]QGG60493.1 hypothetical protein LB003_08465 [Loigolactobacillus bifermentans]